jgi:two-component system response regulator AlgR
MSGAAPARTVLIVDDEPPARLRLRQIMADLPDWRVAGEATHGRQALDLCQLLDPDVVLLDIRMPEMDGIEVARHLAQLQHGPAVIFTTAYDDYAVQAFEAQAVGYLVKPVRRERLARALRHAARLSGRELQGLAQVAAGRDRRSHLCVRKGKGLLLIPVDKVTYFQADQKYVTLHHAGGEELLDETLKDLESEFTERFIRIHRNTLVALPCLERIDTTDDGRYLASVTGRAEPLPVSRRLVAEVKRRLSGLGTTAGRDDSGPQAP